jgi:hypothetical protein
MMDIETLRKEARKIWGDKPMTLEHIAITIGVVYGDICRQARNNIEKGELADKELQKELGNLIFSVVRWCEDLGYEPEACIRLAQEAQTRYRSKV